MQFSSLEPRDLEEKSLMQSSKQRWTRFWYIWWSLLGDGLVFEVCGVHRTVMNSFICFFSMRAPSSRCSDALSLGEMLAGALVTGWIHRVPFHCDFFGVYRIGSLSYGACAIVPGW